MVTRAFLLLVILSWASGARGLAALAEDPSVPALTGRVVDGADLLSVSGGASLAVRLSMHEQEHRHQVVVLTIPSLNGENLEDYATRVFRAWGLGDAERNDGVLLLIARDDRELRIEVGYGLEDRLTDAEAGRIIRSVIVPAFREEDFERGILSGTDAILGAITAEKQPVALSHTPPPEEVKRPYRLGWGLDETIQTLIASLALLLSLFAMWWFWVRHVWTWESALKGTLVASAGALLLWGAFGMFYEVSGIIWGLRYDQFSGTFVRISLGTWLALMLLGEVGFWRQRPRWDRWRRMAAAQRERVDTQKRKAISSRSKATIYTWKSTYVFDGSDAAVRASYRARTSSGYSGGGFSGGSFGGSSFGGGGFSGGGGSSGGGGASGGW